MSFATEVAKSVSDPRVLVDLDIGQRNIQWVNIGAGIWEVNSGNVYPFVDDSLLDGFTAQDFRGVGSVTVDGVRLTEAATLADVTTSDQSFFYNQATGSVYIRAVNYDEPSLHTIFLGLIFGYSFDEFTPGGSDWPYEGRLINIPSISTRRDPLFFGKLVYGGGSVVIANADGELDSFGESNDIYGNESRIFFGYPDVDLDDYVQLYTGFIGGIGVGEIENAVEISDRRKQLSRDITYVSAAANALDTIRDILVTEFSATFNDTFFNTTAWNTAQALVEDVTVNMQEPAPAIDIIQDICTSVFGLFIIDPDGRYSFKIVDTSVAAGTTIFADDIISKSQIAYEPTEVISSARVGYARDWVTTGTQYTYHIDDTAEASVFAQYKTYNQQTFDTYLDNLTAATAFGVTIMERFRTVKGTMTLECPMSYYGTVLADVVDAELLRPSGTGGLGTTKAEIVGVDYNLNRTVIEFGIRFV